MRHQTVPPFLRDGDKAYRWALRHVGDLESDIEEMNEYAPGAAEETFRERAQLYSDFAHEAYREKRLKVYRAIRVPGFLGISFLRLGKAWSRVQGGAGVYGMVPGFKGPSEDYVLTGAVKAVDVDWQYGFTSFMIYGEDQWEVSLLANSPVVLTAIDGKPLDPPIPCNTGDAKEIWKHETAS